MARPNDLKPSIHVPASYPTATIFIDESGSRASASRFYVVGAIKTRRPGTFLRDVADLRDRTGFTSEMKFSGINRGSLSTYCELVDLLAASEAHLAASVVDTQGHNPFRGGSEAWKTQAEVIAQLLVGCINRRELVSVLIDAISTPRGCSVEDRARELVNRRFNATSVVGAVCLDSRSSDGLQVADLVAGAIGFDRKRVAGISGNNNSHKAKIAARLRAAFGLDSFEDQRSQRVNIQTLHGRTTVPRELTVVKDLPRPGLSAG